MENCETERAQIVDQFFGPLPRQIDGSGIGARGDVGYELSRIVGRWLTNLKFM
ncbi:MAG TPA: hypothetical protein VMU99_00700 [Acidimicrobiales bacterium]|nr:hypothetical protein [Acidimicrobiales bacterium]